MGEHDISRAADEQQLGAFMKALLADVRALETMLDSGRFETGVRRIGAEQEMFLVDRHGRPAKLALPMIERLDLPQFTTELALFNLECNLTPHVFGGDCLRRTEEELRSLLLAARAAAAELDGSAIVLTGILPTLRQGDLGLGAMTPSPRYRQLNDVMTAMRGGAFSFRIKGVDELEATHDNVMLESCNTSFQIHFQVGAAEFARLYNLAQLITAPVLAAAVNSPVLAGRRLWHETRVALFQQSVDARSQVHQARGHRPRVDFGDAWVQRSVLEIFREDIARFRVLLATEIDEDPSARLARGEAPALTALRLHNGTVYRWNRPCYGVTDGIPHLRIENRVLPAGPTVLDEMANAAFYFGLMSSLAEEYGDVTKLFSFDDAKANFFAAARHGLRAQFVWRDGRELPARELILDHLLPLARQGLAAADIDAADRSRYLDVLEERVRTGRTGSQWALDSLAAMGQDGTTDQRMRSLTLAAVASQRHGDPVHAWPLARLDDAAGWRASYLTVGQFMTTDLFTVRPGDVVDLAASLMDWRHIRHVPVEDDDGRLVGLVSHRSVLRLIGRGVRGQAVNDTVTVASIMKTDCVTATPNTRTIDAIALMRTRRVGCLPIVEDDRLVGIITEHDLINVASELLEKHLREHESQ